MQTLEDYPNLHDHLSEDEMNDIFDHHGWKVEASEEDITTPIQHDDDDWLGMSSRGHPLYIGSPHH